MKKSIFKAYWLVALTICMLASCTSQKEEIETNDTNPNKYFELYGNNFEEIFG